MTHTTTPRTWFITGASTGPGRELAEAVPDAGGGAGRLEQWAKDLMTRETTSLGAVFPPAAAAPQHQVYLESVTR